MEERAYRLIETLGEGGFGTVYRAEMVSEGGFSKQVALKVLRSDLEMPEEIALRLRDEARILGHVRHRAVVGVDGLAHLDAGWAVVMEYVDGVDAKTLVVAGPTPPRAALEIIEESASALHAAYFTRPLGSDAPLRLIHRDIKPANVRITPTGEVKVLDFGVARADFGTREAETQGMMYGTLTYMAPERIEGESGPEGDVFALGWMLLDLLLGEDRNHPPPLMKARYRTFLEERVERLRALMSGSSPPVGQAEQDELVRFILHMVELDPESRPTARDVERTSRTLRANMPGLWLRDWCEENVPALMSARVSAAGPDQSTGRLLRMRQDSIVWEPEHAGAGGGASSGPVDLVALGAHSGPADASVSSGQPVTPPHIVVPAPTVKPVSVEVSSPIAPVAPASLQSTPSEEQPSRSRPVAAIAAAVVVVVGLCLALIFRPEPPDPSPTEANPAGKTSTVTAPETTAPAPLVTPPPVTTPPVTAPATAPVTTTSEGTTPATPVTSAPARPSTSRKVAPVTPKAVSPVEPAAATGRVVAAGDAKEIKLSKDGRTRGPGNLPPGVWTATALFADGNQLNIGSVTVTADATVTIKCSSALNTCVVR